MKNFIHVYIAAVALALPLAALPAYAQQSGQSGFHSVAERPGASSPSAATTDPTLEAFKSLSEEDRNEVLNQALEAYKSMSPEQKQSLVEQATAMNSTPGSAAANGEWEKLLSPEQQKMISSQIDTTPQNTPAQKTAPAAQPLSMAALLQQIKSLPPAQQQALMNALKGQPAPATPAAAAATATTAATPAAPAGDPCAEFKTANPAFYANCTKRMNPNGVK